MNALHSGLEEGTLVGGTYRVGGLLGRGGMGDVFKVRHERTGAVSALKVLNADFTATPDLLTRFQREAEVTSSLNHPNLVRVFDFDRLPDGRPYLVMELLEGRELAGIMHDLDGGMPLRRVVDLVGQMAMGLAAAHAREIVHRDLKPSNVFVTPLPGTRRELVRILDFGISKVADGRSHLTRTSAIMGTPNYMSPEQARGLTGQIDATTDQWALAAITYEMLTGRIAFSNEEGPLQVLMTVVNEEPATFAELRVAVPGGVESVVRRGLTKNKAGRFPNVTTFASALSRAAREAGVIIGERELDDAGGTMELPPGSSGTSPASGPSSASTTLRHGTGERQTHTKLLTPANDTRTEPVHRPRSRSRFSGVGIGIGAAAIAAALLFFISGRGNSPTPAPAGETAAASPPVDPPALKPVVVVSPPAQPAPAPEVAAPAPAAAVERPPSSEARTALPAAKPANPRRAARPTAAKPARPAPSKRIINEEM